MNSLTKYYKVVNILSLDVVAGAVISSLFFAKLLKAKIAVGELISLGTTVWIIYTIDHLLDANKTVQPASTVRHRFHQRHQKQLLILLAVALIAMLLLLPFISKRTFETGCGLFGVVIIYFLFQQYLKFTKELFGGILYTCGVLLLPVSAQHEIISKSHIILIAQFLITALINLLVFSWFDVDHDSHDYRHSFATLCSTTQVKNVLSMLFTINAGLSALLLTCYASVTFAAIIVLLMNLFLLLLCANKVFFSTNDRYRIIGDAIFLIPLFYIVI